MNREEKLAEIFLKSKKYRVDYEPKGQRSPDFALSDRIGVEVRRLNQYIEVGRKLEPIEKFRYKLIRKVNCQVDQMLYKRKKPSYYFHVEFNRKFTLSKELDGFIKDTLLKVLEEEPESAHYSYKNNFGISFSRKEGYNTENFYSGIEIDDDGGGHLLTNLRRSLDVALREKSPKVMTYLNDYEEWWLVLIDEVTYGIPLLENDLATLSNINWGPFSKVFLLDTDGTDMAYDIKELVEWYS